MDIYDNIEELVSISTNKFKELEKLTCICESISVDIVQGDFDKIARHNSERFEIEILLSKLDIQFYEVVTALEKEGIDSFDKIDAMVYPNIKKLQNIVGKILDCEEKLSTIKLKNNQLLSDIERDISYKTDNVIKAYNKQKLNK